jgi:hypothetical protein
MCQYQDKQLFSTIHLSSYLSLYVQKMKKELSLILPLLTMMYTHARSRIQGQGTGVCILY